MGDWLGWTREAKSELATAQSGKLCLSRVPMGNMSKRAQQFNLHDEEERVKEKMEKKEKEKKRREIKGRGGKEGKKIEQKN